jgi:hypothetical protein
MIASRFIPPVGIFLLCVTCTIAQDRPRWEAFLGWLPEDTETLIVAQSPFEVRRWNDSRWGNPLEQSHFHQDVKRMAGTPELHIKEGGLPHKAFEGLTVICVVEGSRRFREPGTKLNLGGFQYDGVHIMQFAAGADESVKKAFQTCLDKADKKIDVAGVMVASFRLEGSEKNVSTHFFCQPRAGILFYATDQTFLEQTLKRIDKKPVKRALAADLPEWKQVDATASVWAIRHYRKDFADDDPTSPLKEGGFPFGPDRDAIGFVFWYDAQRNAQMRYLTGAKNAAQLIANGLREQAGSFRPRIRDLTPGVVSLTARVGNAQYSVEFYMVLMSCLGHMAYV